jgi:hypothetical protein
MPSPNDSDGKPNTPLRNLLRADHHPVTTVPQLMTKPPEGSEGLWRSTSLSWRRPNT